MVGGGGDRAEVGHLHFFGNSLNVIKCPTWVKKEKKNIQIFNVSVI